MAVDFNYSNSIDAGTPAAAGEIQGNFADLLAWIKSYYQQEADTTAEIAAAITATNVTRLLDTAVQASAPSLSLGVIALVPGMEVSWTAESDHRYRIDVANINIQLGSSNGQRVTLSTQPTAGGTNTLIKTLSISNTLWASVFIMEGSAFLTGLSGAVTYGAYLRRDLLVGASGTPTGSVYAPGTGAVGFIAVSDLGVAP